MRCYDLRSKSLKKPPFRPHFRPFCPHPAYGSSLRAEGGTHFLAPPTRAWHPRPPGHWSPTPIATTPGPAGSGRAQTFPRWATAVHRPRLDRDRAGPDLDDRPPYYSVCHRTGRPLRANQTFLGSRQLVRQDGWQAAIFGGHNRPGLLMVAHQLASTCEVTSLVERNSFRFSRLLADLHHLTTAKIWVAGGGAGGDVPDVLASALGLPYPTVSPSHPSTLARHEIRQTSVEFTEDCPFFRSVGSV